MSFPLRHSAQVILSHRQHRKRSGRVAGHHPGVSAANKYSNVLSNTWNDVCVYSRFSFKSQEEDRVSYLSPLPVDQSSDSANLFGPSSALKTRSNAQPPSCSTATSDTRWTQKYSNQGTWSIEHLQKITSYVRLTCVSRSLCSWISPLAVAIPSRGRSYISVWHLRD